MKKDLKKVLVLGSGPSTSARQESLITQVHKR